MLNELENKAQADTPKIESDEALKLYELFESYIKINDYNNAFFTAQDIVRQFIPGEEKFLSKFKELADHRAYRRLISKENFCGLFIEVHRNRIIKERKISKELIKKEFKSRMESINESKKEFIDIELVSGKTGNTSSKVGGNKFFLPVGSDLPKDAKGNPLIFLAQVNFEEVPALEDFPTKGILQFFIGNDSLWGLKFTGRRNTLEQDSFRVIYYEDISKHIENIEDYPKSMNGPIDPKDEFRMIFHRQEEPITISDFRFDIDLEPISDEVSEDDLEEYYWDKIQSDSINKIGGCPYFTQGDPRTSRNQFASYELLFQLGSDPDLNIMWGDSGVGNFFIDQEDLKKRDFSKVLYYWDCF